MRCDLCGQDTDKPLLPIKIGTRDKVEELRFCIPCYAWFMEKYEKGEFKKISSLTTSQFKKGNCEACKEYSPYLREIDLVDKDDT